MRYGHCTEIDNVLGATVANLVNALGATVANLVNALWATAANLVLRFGLLQ